MSGFHDFTYHSLLQVKFLLLALFLASALYIHYRGKVRHTFTRQVTDHSTFVAPFNALIYMFSKVPTTPYLKTSDLPEMKAVTDNWQVIREEGMKLLDEGHVRVATGYNDLGFNSFFRNGWKRFYVKWYGDPLPSAEQLCPRTVELLKKVPSVHGAMFALLPPGGRLGAHRDPFAGSLRYHLGLRTPNNDNCWIDVDGTRYSWRDGEAVVFDETYVHQAKNDSDINRLILFCDVERPLTSRIMTALNHLVIRYIVKITQTQNVEGEPIGFANKLFAPIYKGRMFFKKVKAWNRKAYYSFKYAAICFVLFLIFVKQ